MWIVRQEDRCSNYPLTLLGQKIRDAQLAHPATSGTLQEIADSDPTAAEGLLWLNRFVVLRPSCSFLLILILIFSRGLEFTSLALRKNVDSNEELTASFTSSYNDSLKKHHNMIVRGIFSVAMKACPYRADFYKKLGDDQAAVETKMKEWLAALEKIVGILNVYLAAKKI